MSEAQKPWYAPNGEVIVGTLETVLGVAMITDIEPGGKPVYSGETDVDWDTQKPVMRGNSRLYRDENGFNWEYKDLTREAPAEVTVKMTVTERDKILHALEMADVPKSVRQKLRMATTP